MSIHGRDRARGLPTNDSAVGGIGASYSGSQRFAVEISGSYEAPDAFRDALESVTDAHGPIEVAFFFRQWFGQVSQELSLFHGVWLAYSKIISCCFLSKQIRTALWPYSPIDRIYSAIGLQVFFSTAGSRSINLVRHVRYRFNFQCNLENCIRPS